MLLFPNSAFQYFLLFDMIMVIYLLGRYIRLKKYAPARGGDSINPKRCQIWQPNAEIDTVIDQFYKYSRYSVRIPLQIEKYSLSFAHIGPDAP